MRGVSSRSHSCGKTYCNLIVWCAAGCNQVLQTRYEIVHQIERLSSIYINSGQTELWLKDADPCVQKVSKCVNGPLIEHLARIAGHTDLDCVQLFRNGRSARAHIMLRALLAVSGAELYDESAKFSKSGWTDSNKELLSTLREDVHESELMEVTLMDVELDRMTRPVAATEVDLDAVCSMHMLSR